MDSNTIIDFDKKELNERGEEELIFPIDDHDAINMGVWIQLHHPNFFDGNWKDHLRYVFWLVSTFIIMNIQIIFVANLYWRV